MVGVCGGGGGCGGGVCQIPVKTELDHRTRARESKMLTIFAKEKNIPEEISGQGRLNPEMSSPLKDKARAEFRRFRHL